MASTADSLEIPGRLQMRVRPAAVAESLMEMAMLGHCPGQARWWYLLENPQTLQDIIALGFTREIRQLQDWLANGAPETPTAAEAELLGLYRLPIPFLSLAQFQVLFPDAERQPTQYKSQMAGNIAWLPDAIADFFQPSQADVLLDGVKKLWMIRIPEAQAQSGFLPDPDADYSQLQTLSGFDRAMLIPNLGLLAMPDLERLQVPANLPDVRRLRLVNAEPVFLPCTQTSDDEHRERRRSQEIPKPEHVWDFLDLLKPIQHTLKKRRPDLQCLLSLPLAQISDGSLPSVDTQSLQTLQAFADTENSGLAAIQFLFPYLTRKNKPLASPVGLIAGAMVDSSQRFGPWRSMAGRRLPGHWQLFPALHSQRVAELRESPGVGVLVMQQGKLWLDDERRAAPVVGRDGFVNRQRWQTKSSAYQSGEVARFLGWLQRQLLRLGENWLFNIDVRDPLGKAQLNRFFIQLHKAGALRGALPEQAFSIVSRHDGESTLIYEIELAPVFPIDRIILNFSHTLGSNSSPWQVEIEHG